MYSVPEIERGALQYSVPGIERLHQSLSRDLGRLHLVPAHIEEFVKAGVKRARRARRAPEFTDFEPGIEATKSIAVAKPA